MALLEINDLIVLYGEIEALRGVSLKVDAGQVVTLLGSNGAGKSTLVNALLGEDRLLTGPEAGITRDTISRAVPSSSASAWCVVCTARPWPSTLTKVPGSVSFPCAPRAT